MPRFSAFNSTRFSSKPSYEEQIYREMVKSLGSGKNFSDDWDSLVSARLYAWAMALGRCKYEIERLGHQWDPYRAREGLPVLERELGVIPEPGASISQRRAGVIAASRIARGASRPNVEAIMTELFGADFVAYITTDVADIVVSPAIPTASGVYDRPGGPRAAFLLLDYVATMSAAQVRLRLLAGNVDTIRVGKLIVLDTGNYSRAEAVRINAVDVVDPNTRRVTATFKHPHDVGTVVATGRHASQYTSKRVNTFQLTSAAAADATKRRRLHRVARSLLRGISQWSIADSSGPFRTNVSMLNVTPIEALP